MAARKKKADGAEGTSPELPATPAPPRIPRSPFTLPSDEGLAPSLQASIPVLRALMVETGDLQEMPEAFDAWRHDTLPMMRIVHVDTGRSHAIPLFAYGELRRALSAAMASTPVPTAGNGARFALDHDGETIYDASGPQIPIRNRHAAEAVRRALQVLMDGLVEEKPDAF